MTTTDPTENRATVQAVANPGSDEALDAGCSCPILDNGHGRGYLGGVKDPETGETMFVINGSCPLHGTAAEVSHA